MKIEMIALKEEETLSLGERLGRAVTANCLVTLSGDLGAGKTTFTKGIGKGLGITKVINSPTFTIVKQYQGRYRLSHFDAYRLEGQSDDLGFDEIFESDDICVVEWANYIEDLLPTERLEIHLYKIDEVSRKIVLIPIGEKYEQICQRLIV